MYVKECCMTYQSFPPINFLLVHFIIRVYVCVAREWRIRILHMHYAGLDGSNSFWQTTLS